MPLRLLFFYCSLLAAVEKLLCWRLRLGLRAEFACLLAATAFSYYFKLFLTELTGLLIGSLLAPPAPLLLLFWKVWILSFDPPKPIGFFIMFRLKEGSSIDPFIDGALTLRTVYLRLVGDGSDTICRAIPSISSPSYVAIDSKSASFSAAN